ncbi:helicase associated domain-containing protein [Streptomyces tsukubensis]|uniref:helicase associated domain-containing protein n=1 Tax=Streptomyces tsukubensis TaxID=83656 RepID=UPI0034506296
MTASTVPGRAALWPHQQDAVVAITRRLRTEERVTAVMACGTGKTRVGAAVAQETVPNDGIVLIAAPLLELLTQTVREWRDVLGDRGLGQVIAVCSDPAAARYHQGDLDDQRATVTADGNHLARLVRDFRDRHGHADIPQSHIAPGGENLGTWLSNRKADVRNGRLAPDRIRALLDLGVTITGLPKGHKR